MGRVRKSITISDFLAKDIETASFIDTEIDFSNRIEYLCRTAILMNKYGRQQALKHFNQSELEYIYTCLRGFVAMSQVNPVLEVHSLVCQFTEVSCCHQAFGVDSNDVSSRILELSEIAAFALIGLSQEYWNEQQKGVESCTSLTENN